VQSCNTLRCLYVLKVGLPELNTIDEGLADIEHESVVADGLNRTLQVLNPQLMLRPSLRIKSKPH